ncbi:MAG: hypothetical protein AB1489_04400 [Acidobacteriota bacterium]
MKIAEKLDQAYRRLLAATDSEQELTLTAEFISQFDRGEIFAEMVRYFTTRLEDVILKLRQLTLQNKPPGQLARLENPQVWGTFAWALSERRLPQIGHDLFMAMYEFQLGQQAEQRRRLYKGISLLNLAWMNYLLGKQDVARKGARLALVEEVINTLDMDDVRQLRIVSANPAYLMLQQTFKLPTPELDTFIRFSRNYARMHPERCAFPEDCYLSYLRATAIGPRQRAIDEKSRVSQFNQAYFTNLLDMVGRAATGSAAEPLVTDLICYLFTTVDDFYLCEHDHSLPADGFDLIVRNCALDDPALMELGAYLAAEWRNWTYPLSISDILATAGKLRLTGLRTAILFTRDSEPDAHSSAVDQFPWKATVQRLYQQERLIIIIITQKDLIEIERRHIDLPTLIKLRAEALRFSRRYYIEKSFPTETHITPELPPPYVEPQPPMINPVTTSMATMPTAPPPINTLPPVPLPPMAAMPTVPPPPPITSTPVTTPMPPPVQPVSPPAKLPRLVIRNTSSRGNTPTTKSPDSSPSLTYNAVTAKAPEAPMLKPCTNCQNATSLACQGCSRAFCHMHLTMPGMRCQDCLAAAAQTPAEPKENS